MACWELGKKECEDFISQEFFRKYLKMYILVLKWSNFEALLRRSTKKSIGVDISLIDLVSVLIGVDIICP